MLAALKQRRPSRGRPTKYDHLHSILDGLNRAGFADISAAQIRDLFGISEVNARQVLHRYRERNKQEEGA